MKGVMKKTCEEREKNEEFFERRERGKREKRKKNERERATSCFCGVD